VLENKRDTLIASNKSLAEYNLAREPAFRATRQALADAHKEAQDLRREVDAKREKLNELSRQTSLDTTLALMQTATAEADEESERIANQFLMNEIPVETFVSKFNASRKTAHLRRIKTEKLDEYIKKQQRQQQHQQYTGIPAESLGPVRPAPPPPSLPYPVAPVSMPQANYPFSRPTYPPY
jgi:ESCRT-I complex subunit VPS37